MDGLNVYILRHGQTDLNVAQKWQGSASDCLLNETGKKQAEALGEKIKNIGIRRLYCSSLLRAVQTANIVAEKITCSKPICIVKDLRECDFGDFEGLTYDEVDQKYGDIVQDYLWPTRETWVRKFPNGECKEDVYARAMHAILNIVIENENLNGGVGVVCHAGVISSIACGLGLSDVCYDNCRVLHLFYDFDKHQFIHIKN